MRSLTRPPPALTGRQTQDLVSDVMMVILFSYGLAPAGRARLGPGNKLIRCGGLVFNSIKVFARHLTPELKTLRQAGVEHELPHVQLSKTFPNIIVCI